MLQSSKIHQSLEIWKRKAIDKAAEGRECRKTIQRHKKTIAKLKNEIKSLKQLPRKENKKK